MRELSITERAYIAGLFEGEASFCFTTLGYPRVQIEMTDFDVMNNLAVIFNQKLCHRNPVNPKHKESWKLALCKAQVVLDVLTQLLPFMGVRRTEKINSIIDNLTERGFKPSYT